MLAVLVAFDLGQTIFKFSRIDAQKGRSESERWKKAARPRTTRDFSAPDNWGPRGGLIFTVDWAVDAPAMVEAQSAGSAASISREVIWSALACEPMRAVEQCDIITRAVRALERSSPTYASARW